MTTIKLRIKDIRAVSHAMAVGDIRYYLNGMLFEHNGAETRLVATDGHRIHGVIVNHPDALIESPQQFIVPDTLIRTILKVKAPKHDKVRQVTLTFADGKVSALLPDGTESIAKLIDGKFPDYSRVIPQTVSGEYAPVNLHYAIDAMQGAADYMEVKEAHIGVKYNGSGVAVLCVGTFFAGIMPLRLDQSSDPDTAWFSPIAAPEVTESQATA
jgi:hypothetical protein